MYSIVELMKNYSLDNLLSQAWKFDPPTLSDAEITEVIESISDNKLKEQYLRDRKTSSNQQLQHHLLIDYRLPNMFLNTARVIVPLLPILLLYP